MLNKTNIAIVLAIIAILVGVTALVGGNQSKLGASGTRFPHGLAVGTADVTTAGGFFMKSAATTTLSILSTSSTQGICIPFNATSTNTLLNLTFRASTTAVSAAGVTPQINYGACS